MNGHTACALIRLCRVAQARELTKDKRQEEELTTFPDFIRGMLRTVPDERSRTPHASCE
jgi:hypothetical protein